MVYNAGTGNSEWADKDDRKDYEGMFNYASSHRDYMNTTHGNEKADNLNPFKMYRIDEIKPIVGDIICTERNYGSNPHSYDDLNGVSESHCDIIVEVNQEENKIEVIGGNTGDSATGVKEHTVGRKSYNILLDTGYIDKDALEGNYLGIIRVSTPSSKVSEEEPLD